MKRTAITILLILTAVCGYSQSAYDGLIFSENNYEGTARSVAMGNAKQHIKDMCDVERLAEEVNLNE